jgi:DHA2 family multidrug resistance protein-like MFS transporter
MAEGRHRKEAGRQGERPVPGSKGPENRWLVLAVLASSLLVVALDATILNVALPTLAADLEPSSTELLWIVDAYGLVLAGLLVAMSGLGDRVGRRRLLVAGLATFAVAAALAALAQSAPMLIAARVLLGVGGAMIMPSTVTLLRTVFLDDRERAIAVGVWSAVAAGGFAVGPIVGGALLEVADWPWVFGVQVPVVLLAIVAVVRLVPEWRSADPGPWDPIGVALSIGGIVALVWGIKEASKHGFGDMRALVALLAGAGALTAFLRRQRTLTHPLLDVSLFRDRRFSASVLAVLAVFFGFGGLLLLLTQFLQIVQGHGPLESGLRLLPLAIAAAVFAPLTDAAVRRVGAHVVVGGGFAVVAAAFAALHGLDAGTAYPLIGAALGVLGAGAGMASTAASAVILASAPPERAAGAVAVQETAYELGGALGVAILGSVMTARYRATLDGVAGVPAEARESLPAAAEVGARAGGDAGAALIAAAERAFLDGLDVTLVVAAAVTAAIAATAFAFMPRQRTLGAGARPAQG